MAKRANGIAEFSLTDGVLKWDFGKLGSVVVDSRGMFPDYDEMTESQQRTIVNGLKQRTADGGAKGQDATLADKFEGMSRIADALNVGDYGVERELTGGVLARAIVEVTGNTLANVRAILEKKTATERRALEYGEKYGPTVERMKREIAARIKVDDTEFEVN